MARAECVIAHSEQEYLTEQLYLMHLVCGAVVVQPRPQGFEKGVRAHTISISWLAFEKLSYTQLVVVNEDGHVIQYMFA